MGSITETSKEINFALTFYLNLVLIWIGEIACLLLHSSFSAIMHLTLTLETEEAPSETRSTQCFSLQQDAVQHVPGSGRYSEVYIL